MQEANVLGQPRCTLRNPAPQPALTPDLSNVATSRWYADAMNPWLLTVAGFLVGLAVGAALVFAWSRRGRNEPTARRLRREYDNYRQEVSTHFAETAELVNRLTTSYQAVYDHLERGAARLIGPESSPRALADANPQLSTRASRHDEGEPQEPGT